MIYCAECEAQLNLIINIPGDHNKIYIDAECPRCNTRYTGTLKKMQKRQDDDKTKES